MTATIDDVARRAQVSVATVSRALRGLPNVAPSTRIRVLEAAQDLRYVADPSASRLAGGKSRTIALVVPMLGQWYYAKIFSGVEAVAAAAGYDLLPYTTGAPGSVTRFLDALTPRRKVDGVLVVDVQLSDEDFARLDEAGIDVVTVGVDRWRGPGLRIDNAAAARLAVGHLTGLGHERIALIGGIDDDPFHFSVPVDRFGGYRDALRAAGLPYRPELVVPGNFSLEGGAEAMNALLASPAPPTAVFACSDEMAIGAMQVAQDAGLRVPGQLSIVGFDDHDVAEYVGLTTIRQDVTGQGERAAQLLLSQLVGDERTEGQEVHPTRLIVRRTTGPPPDTGELR